MSLGVLRLYPQSITLAALSDDHDYIEKNRELWNSRVDHHLDSAFYNVEGFLKGETSLKEIELELLGDINGKKALHLQCHFGMDTISLARMGAKATGADFSENAIMNASELASKACVEVDFVCCDLYSLTHCLGGNFDLVFSSYGTIGWLPDLDKWAQIIAGYLVPGGRFVFTEFHPFVWMFDNDFRDIVYKYFKDNPIVEKEQGTYANKDADINLESVSWNHGLSEVISALLKVGLKLEVFREYDYSPYNCLQGMSEITPGRFVIEKFGDKVPLVYALVAVKML